MEIKKSELSKMNRFAILGWTLVVAVIELAYLLEVIKGERSVMYYALMLLVGLIPLGIGWGIYKRDVASNRLRHIMVFTYSILYAFVLLTGDTALTFIYLFPVMSTALCFGI